MPKRPKKLGLRERKQYFREHSIFCGGELYDRELIGILGVNRQTLWRYKKEAIREARQRAGLE